MSVRHSLVAAMCIGACIVVFAFAAQAANKATGEPCVPGHGDLRVDTNLVPIPVSVTDSKNHPVVGIELRNQYVVGCRPNRVEPDGKFHKVQ